MDYYVTNRQLSWTYRTNVRLPKKLLSSWVCNRRPKGAPGFTYGCGVMKALKKAGVDVDG